MAFIRNGKLRLLYVLALAQLVGGPLILMQVTLFCKLTVKEVPRMKVAEAAARAWHSDEFQTALAAGVSTNRGETKTPPPSREPKDHPDKAKPPVIPWQRDHLALAVNSAACSVVNRERIWTPAWPQAPPGPPPRWG